MKLLETITPEAISALPSGDGQALGYNPTTGTLVRVPSTAAAVAGLMLSALDFEMTAITYDVTYTDVIASAVVKWADGGAGVFTTITINTTWHKVDAFTVTHAGLGKTVTQAAVTRNAFGAVTTKPALTIA